MKVWNFTAESNPKEISEKLESAFGSLNGIAFKMNHDNANSIPFKLRKRVLYGWYMAFHNWTIVNGELLKTDTENKTNVEISFSHHFLIQLIIYTHIFLGMGFLIAIISGISNDNGMYILGGIVLALGIILWLTIQKKFKKDIQKYKSLISEILEL